MGICGVLAASFFPSKVAYARLGAAGIDAYDNLLARRDGGSWDVTTMMTTAAAAAATDVML